MANEERPNDTSLSERVFKAASPWIGAGAFCVCGYYLLERNQDVPWYVFGICGALMGFGELMVQINKARKP